MNNQRELQKDSLLCVGILHATNVPGFALFFTMVGFAALAKDSGFYFEHVLITTLTVWGMPGQVALVSLYASGASLAVIFLAVALANMRMMLMVISGYNMLRFDLHDTPFWQKVFLMHLMAITSWAQINFIKEKYEPRLLLSYYIGFSVTIYVFGVLGTMLGFVIDNFVTNEVLRIIMFITPLYILLLIISSKDNINRLSVILGGTIVPLIFPFFLEWSILIGGLFAGSIAFGYSILANK